MLKKMFLVLVSLLFVFGIAQLSFAQHCHSGHERGTETSVASPAAGEVVNVGNKICPVSGEKIGQGMEPLTYEYQGKIYNFCCAGCIEEFKKDPEKYIKKVNEELNQKLETPTK